MPGPATVDDYLATLPPEQRGASEELRSTIRAALPEASEEISYQMPVYKVNGKPVVWWAAYARHFSLYPATERLRSEFGDELEPYLAGKGTIRFAADRPLPLELVAKIARIRLAEVSAAGR